MHEFNHECLLFKHNLLQRKILWQQKKQQILKNKFAGSGIKPYDQPNKDGQDQAQGQEQGQGQGQGQGRKEQEKEPDLNSQWILGFIEADGCFYYGINNKSYRPYFAISKMIDSDILKYIRDFLDNHANTTFKNKHVFAWDGIYIGKTIHQIKFLSLSDVQSFIHYLDQIHNLNNYNHNLSMIINGFIGIKKIQFLIWKHTFTYVIDKNLTTQQRNKHILLGRLYLNQLRTANVQLNHNLLKNNNHFNFIFNHQPIILFFKDIQHWQQ